MPVGRIRDLSQYGVNTDIDAYNLPENAFTMAVNARFQDSGVGRAPVFRRVPLTLASADPRFLGANFPTSGFDAVIIGYKNGRVSSYASGTEDNISIAGYVDNSSDAIFTLNTCSNVLYINRSDRVPWYKKTTDTDFVALPNWDSGWRAEILRSSHSALCAFGITKSGTYYPQMVKTSEFALAGDYPSSWDEADPTTNATENVLAEMEGEIIDAQNLGDNIVIYGRNEAWAMTFDGSQNIWAYERLFKGYGAINTNCVVEVNRQHFVFGPTDIWKHDGVSPQSISDQRVRKFVFNNLNLAKANRCFVEHDELRKEIRFSFVSGDAYTAFPTVDGCNRCAVYRYSNDTWAFDDLPYVFGTARANLDTVLTYAAAGTAGLTYATIGSTYQDQESTIKKVLTAVGDVNAAAGLTLSLYAIDEQGPGSIVAYPVDTAATQGVTLERDGLDLDSLVDLVGYKVVNTIYPQARLEVDAEPLTFSYGSQDYFNQTAVFGDDQTYDGDTLYKLDFNVTGRFLSMRMTHDDYHWFRLTGFDIDLSVDGMA
jgi:hypothetical protein